MDTREVAHPAFPDLIRTVPAGAVKAWQQAGWTPVAAAPAKKATPKRKATKKATRA